MIFRILLLSALLCLAFRATAAEEGRLTGVGPFAVYVEFEGPGPELEQEVRDAIYAILRQSRVPTADAKGIENEDSPFLHFQLLARRIAKPSGFLFTARMSVKIPSTNPFNGFPMQGLVASGLTVNFEEDQKKFDTVVNTYLKESVGHLILSWRKQNPLPQTPEPVPDAETLGDQDLTSNPEDKD